MSYSFVVSCSSTAGVLAGDLNKEPIQLNSCDKTLSDAGFVAGEAGAGVTGVGAGTLGAAKPCNAGCSVGVTINCGFG